MRKVLKWIGIVLGAIVGLLLLAAIGIIIYSQVTFKRSYADRPLYPIVADTSPEGVARGKYLMEAVMSCDKACHSEGSAPFAGYVEEVNDGPISAVFAVPNLTSDSETGLGSWSDAEIARAIREGVDKDGVGLVVMPAYNYKALSDADVAAIHTPTTHNVAGRIYSSPAATARTTLAQDDLTPWITCESCHTSKPHKEGVKANDHTDKVACQTCHIPEFARVLPTKMSWDWSTAGQKKDGKPYKEKGPLGPPSYDTQKGNFVWDKNIRPQYFWYNGTIDAITAKDAIDPSKHVALNWPVGSLVDPHSRIAPFKVHTGKQPWVHDDHHNEDS